MSILSSLLPIRAWDFECVCWRRRSLARRYSVRLASTHNLKIQIWTVWPLSRAPGGLIDVVETARRLVFEFTFSVIPATNEFPKSLVGNNPWTTKKNEYSLLMESCRLIYDVVNRKAIKRLVLLRCDVLSF